jgi:hypothetical protein
VKEIRKNASLESLAEHVRYKTMRAKAAWFRWSEFKRQNMLDPTQRALSDASWELYSSLDEIRQHLDRLSGYVEPKPKEKTDDQATT